MLFRLCLLGAVLKIKILVTIQHQVKITIVKVKYYYKSRLTQLNLPHQTYNIYFNRKGRNCWSFLTLVLSSEGVSLHLKLFNIFKNTMTIDSASQTAQSHVAEELTPLQHLLLFCDTACKHAVTTSQFFCTLCRSLSFCFSCRSNFAD